jgi:hypothetical protein
VVIISSKKGRESNVTNRKIGNSVRLNLEILEDRLTPSSLGSLPLLPTGTPGVLMPAPSGLAPPPALTSTSQLLPGPWLNGPPPSGQLPALTADMIAMADQIFAQMAAMYGTALELAISQSAH